MTSTEKQESIVLCEGYHDRAFWSGLLVQLECVDPGLPTATKSVRTPVVDPWGKSVAGGEYAFRTGSGRFIRVRPCQGKERVLREAVGYLRRRSEGDVEYLVLNIDSDQAVGADERSGVPALATVLDKLRELDAAASESEDGDIVMFGSRTRVSLLVWRCDDPPSPGLPQNDTLERLVCASLIAVHPERGAAVQNWLNSRGAAAPAAGPKEHAWSHMAGWYAENGCEAFYKLICSDEKVFAELRLRLEVGDCWRILEALTA